MKQPDFQSQLKKLQQRKELLIILLFLFVIIIFWIGLGIFSSQQTAGISSAQKERAVPLSPSLDAQVIEKLEQKKSYSISELADFPIFITQTNSGAASVTSSGGSAGTQQVALPEDLEDTLEAIEQDF